MQKEHVYILGCPNFANYEASAALIKVPLRGGEIEYVVIGEDRLTRLKHTYMFPLRGMHYCLQSMGLDSLSQVDYIVTDYARLPRWLNSGPAYRKLEHDYLKVNLDFPRQRIVFTRNPDWAGNPDLGQSMNGGHGNAERREADHAEPPN